MAGEITAHAGLKAALRNEIVAARDAQPADRRRALSARITRRVTSLETYRTARCVLAYMSFGSEFETADFVADALALGKQLCLPRVDRGTRRLEIHLINDIGHDLQSGVWGIREPRAECPRADINQVDFVLLPGVAFTPRCERLGYGGGYYDRLITQFATRPALAAAAFALQIRAQIPLGAHDQRIDTVETEDTSYCRG